MQLTEINLINNAAFAHHSALKLLLEFSGTGAPSFQRSL